MKDAGQMASRSTDILSASFSKASDAPSPAGGQDVRAPRQLGIFAKTITRASFSEVLEVIAQYGLHSIQFNFACVGLPSMPEVVVPEVLEQVRRDCETRGIGIVGVSGTFNMIHPDAAQRAGGLRRLEVLAPAVRAMGCDFISLCTGTRDAQDMWRSHPDNGTPEAWRDLGVTLEQAVQIAERHNILLGLEPETGNVVSSARQARQLLDEMKSPRLKIILDPANLFHGGRTERMRETIAEAFDLLAPDMHMAHAKELAADGGMGSVAPGQGVIDWDFYLQCLQRMRFTGPVIMHGLPETTVAGAVAFLRQRSANMLSAGPLIASTTCGQDVRTPE